MHWIQFLVSAGLIVAAGTRLTRYTDLLCEKLNLGRAWIGVVLLGLVTSLPELITSSVAVVTLKAGDLAVGNVIGSNNFNPLMIVVMDFAYRKGSITDKVRPGPSHRYSASIAALMTVIVIAEIFFSRSVSTSIFGPVTYGTFLLLVCYVGGMLLLSRVSKAHVEELIAGGSGGEDKPLSVIWGNIGAMAAVVTLSAVFLTGSADVIAETTGLGRTFVGSILLAIVTSLPEMVVTLSAVKLGSLDLAIGNIFGSNIVNMFIIFIFSLLYSPGLILADVSLKHIGTAVMSLIITAVAVFGIYAENKKVIAGIGLDSIIMAGIFIFGNYFIYFLLP